MVGEDVQLTTKSKIDLSELPPCRGNLIPHIRRVNHLLAVYKQAYILIFSSPKPQELEQGWESNEECVFGGQIAEVYRCRLEAPADILIDDDARITGENQIGPSRSPNPAANVSRRSPGSSTSRASAKLPLTFISRKFEPP